MALRLRARLPLPIAHLPPFAYPHCESKKPAAKDLCSGGNVEGLTAASYLYFGRSPTSLTPAEAAFLFLLPQAPARWETYTPSRWQEARQRTLERLAGCGLLTSEDVRQASDAPLPTVRQPFPLHAAHLADYLRQQYPMHVQLRTTI